MDNKEPRSNSSPNSVNGCFHSFSKKDIEVLSVVSTINRIKRIKKLKIIPKDRMRDKKLKKINQG